MSYKEAWDFLNSLLQARAEYWWYETNSNPDKPCKYVLKSIETTLEQMKILEKGLLKVIK